MAHLPLPRLCPPTRLLLALLTLLLGGQGAFCGTAAAPPPRELRLTVARTDSLTAATPGRPATLYLTLDLHNDTRDDLLLLDLHGTLYYRSQRWPWQATNPGGESLRLPIPVQARRQLPCAIALAPADSVPALRAALHTARFLPQLAMQGAYSRRGSERGGRRTFQAFDYVQLLRAR